MTQKIVPVIRQLSAHTINLIAAGEVIERPSAVVKELVENALDAGAKKITIRLLGGGIQSIEVIDDGCGMGLEDLCLSIQRHCTSKLHENDLVHISTLGFRGEALPSIGAAAHLRIVSRVHNGDQAWQIDLNNGQLIEPSPAAGQAGTRVVVEDLFFATPARRKFLKSPKVEASRCEQVVQRLAIARPSIGFCLQIEDRIVFDLPPQSQEIRIQTIFTGIHTQELIPIDFYKESFQLKGFMSTPSISRSTTAAQVMVVNGRPVTDPIMQTAIRVAYRSVLEKGRYPVVALFLEVPLDRVDVNVHPAKTELRFADEALVRSLIIGSLQRLLATGAGEHGMLSSLPRQSYTKPANIIYPARDQKNQFTFAVNPLASRFTYPKEEANLKQVVAKESFQPESSVNPVQADLNSDFPLGMAFAQIFKTYILSMTEDQGLVVVDQHAAHERLTHEALRQQYLEKGIKAQRLLLPEIVELSSMEATRLLDFKESLSDFGIEIESFGGSSLLVRTLPELLGNTSASMLLKDLAEELKVDEQASPQESEILNNRLDAMIARLACHGSIRAGRTLNIEEMNALLRKMETTPKAGTCAHGRPTWLKWSKEDIEKLFHRT